ncbi:ATP-binding protein [Abditibacterium utsteinense]|uniref:ATP-binding protein n=1 Tax=Abditibacterium utsteinense TaxID=1960156 RepID=A0A2S8SSS9_9BACT|nr:ABC transporter ATP-binding protein [Abditibacterium utsteinense]PQV63845.1 ATP-binding protein [Abditibacterium utsteinense]
MKPSFPAPAENHSIHAIEPAIEVENLTKKFRVLHRERSVKSAVMRFLVWQLPRAEEFIALENVSFQIPKGQTVGVVGQNGQGKSTLLALLARIYRPSKGRITVRGRIVSLLELGAGFQPEFTGYENIYLNGIIYGFTRAELDAKLDSIAEFAGISDHLTQQVKHYSSGMKARLGFSIAVHVDPDVLLVDEVLAVGDANFQEKCFAKIEEFQRRGVTMFVVSHDARAIARVCDRVLWIENHRIKLDGDAKTVLSAYESTKNEVISS